ncbi:hypothetical protein Tco_1441529, partial [Tanacetum coccineum]
GGENGDDYEGGNRGVNGNGNDNGNGGGNDNGNGNGNGGGNGTEGVVGLTCWFEKMEMVFHISNCPQKNQVKYATCTLLDNALTWWNTHKRTIRIEAAYAMTWTELMKLMTEVRFQELVMLCTRMVLDEEDKVKRFIGGLPNNIQGNGYVRSTENKRRFDNNPRDDHREDVLIIREFPKVFSEDLPGLPPARQVEF